MRNLAIVETILRNRAAFFNDIRTQVELVHKILTMLISCFVFLAIYGAVMGASHSAPQAVSSFLKLPLLFLVTLVICAPSLHFFSILFGSQQTALQSISLILTAMTTTSVLLVSLAPITFFFLLTSNSYAFFKLLNVVFFAICGAMGVVFLRQGMAVVTESDTRAGLEARRTVFLIWVLLYAFVGSQMAWTLSPFLGEPGKPFILFTQFGGNFYSDVINSLMRLLMWRG
jgi:hypothetical protein